MATVVRLYRRPVGGNESQVTLVDQISDDGGDYLGGFKFDGTGAGVAVPAGTYDFSMTSQTDGLTVSDHTPVQTKTVAAAAGAVSVADDFNTRATLADATHPWVAPTGMTAPTLTADHLTQLAAVRAAYWNDPAIGANQYSELAQTGVIQGSGPAVRMQDSGDNCYVACRYFDIDTETQSIQILRIANGAIAGGVASVGDVAGTLRIKAVGSTISALVNGVEVCSGTDTTYASGHVGVRVTNTISDNWAGGTA